MRKPEADNKQQPLRFSVRSLLLALTLASLLLGGLCYVGANATRWYLEILRSAQEHQKFDAEKSASK